ncbi:hypothetical protein ASC71_15530 [Rhizobium sp. Root1240]|nr:hypothetical protein ASC71_15530 [Rhizobium sp. Root1240]
MQSSRLQVDIFQIMAYETDEPNAVIDFLDSVPYRLRIFLRCIGMRPQEVTVTSLSWKHNQTATVASGAVPVASGICQVPRLSKRFPMKLDHRIEGTAVPFLASGTSIWFLLYRRREA